MYRSHWSERVRETIIRRTHDGLLNLKIRGGAELGNFPYFGKICDDDIIYESENRLAEGDLLLEVNNQTVAGLTLYDLNTIISRAEDPVRLKSVREGNQIMKELRRYLSMKTEKGSVDNDLQNMVRDNLYLRTLPCTTRAPRDGEQDGVDYTFLTREEFEELERKGLLVEAGTYEGNHYGTPRPPKNPPSDVLNDFDPDLPHGWEMARTDSGQIYYIDHINEITSWIHPSQIENDSSTPQPDDTLKKTISNEPDGSPNKRPYIGQIGENLEGDVIDVILVKGERGFGFTIVGGDEPGEMIQINAIVATGNPRPSGSNGVKPGDVLLRVNDETVLGRHHHEVVSMFAQVEPGQTAALQLLRNDRYKLPDAEPEPINGEKEHQRFPEFSNHQSMPDLAKLTIHNQVTSRTISQPHLPLTGNNHEQTISYKIKKGEKGFGFTVADSNEGQQVKQVVESERCAGLQSEDLIVAINGQNVQSLSHDQLVMKLKAFPVDSLVTLTIKRQAEPSPSSIAKYKQRALGEFDVTLHRKQAGFGFRILSGDLTNPKVTIGNIVEGGAAHENGMMQRGDILIAVDENPVTGLSHSDVILFMSNAARNGVVKLTLRRENDITRTNSNSTFKYSEHSDKSNEPSDTRTNGSDNIELAQTRENITLVRNESEGFGFVIMSSPRAIPRHRIGRVLIDTPAYRAQLRVGDRVLAVNDVSMDDLPHDRIVDLIRQSGQRLQLLTIPILRWKTELNRGSAGFGFGLRGGRDHNLPFFILRVAPDGPAAKSGNLRVGDIVEAINQTETDGLTHQEAIKLIKSGGDRLILTLQRGNGNVPDIPKQENLSNSSSNSRR